MSAELFHDAIQMAKEALVCGNQRSFQDAIERARTQVCDNPDIAQYLQQAYVAYPTSNCIASLSAACMIAAQIEFNDYQHLAEPSLS